MSDRSTLISQGGKKSKEKEKDNKSTPIYQTVYRAFSYSFSYPLLLISVYSLIIAISLLSTYNPGLGEQLVHILGDSNKADQVTMIIFQRFAVEAILAILEALKNYAQPIFSQKVEKKMQTDFYRSLMEKDIEYYDSKKVGEISNKLNTDITTLKVLAVTNVSGLVNRGFTLVGSFIFMMNLSPGLAFLAAILTLPRVGVVYYFKDYFKEGHKVISKLRGETNSVATEALSSMRTIKAFSGESKELKKYVKSFGNFMDANRDLSYKETLYYLGLHFLRIILFCSITLYGVFLVKNTDLTAYQLSRLIGYARQFSQASVVLEENIKRIVSSVGGAQRIFKELDAKPKIFCNKEAIISEKDGLRSDISLKNVSFSYSTKPDVQVMNNVNLTIKKGEHIAIVGESGGGKSTLISLLQRLYDPVQGEIRIGNHNIKDIDYKWLRSRIGVIPQEPVLFSGTIEENIVYGVDVYGDDDVDKAMNGAHMKKFVNDKSLFPEGLQSNVGERGNKLSGGQKQRVAIARALIKKPDILILDEATSSLDAESEHQVMEGLGKFVKSQKQTVIIVTHRLSTIKHCDRIIVFKNGDIVEEGAHDELLLRDGAYTNLINSQYHSKVKTE